MKLSELSVRRPVFATVISLLLIIFGLVSLQRLSVREYPDIDRPVVSITTTYTGASAAVIETKITQVIEDSIAGIEGILKIESDSEDERSSVRIEFDVNREIDGATNDVRDRVSRVLGSLPEEADPPEVLKADASSEPIMYIMLGSNNMTVLELYDYAERNLIDRLSTVPGVARVSPNGGGRYSMRVWLDRQALAARQLTVTDIEDALRRENVELPAGRIESKTREFTLRTLVGLQNEQDFRDLVIARGSDGHLIRLGEVANVQLAAESDRATSRFDGQAGVSMGVEAQSKANTLDIVRGVRAEIDKLQATLPRGMKLEVGVDNGVAIEAALHEVIIAVVFALIAVLVVIYAFLGSLRATLIPAVTIPVSIVASFTVMYAMGYSVNVLTLLGLVLAIGLVVDDAIVVLENVHRRSEAGEPPLMAAVTGSSEIGFAVIATTLTLAAVFIPISFLPGDIGRLFSEFGFTLAASVLFSALVALTLTPMLASKLPESEAHRNRFAQAVDRFFRKLAEVYDRRLRSLIRRPWLVIGMVGALMVLGALTFRSVPSEFTPVVDSGRVSVTIEAPEGTSFNHMYEYALKLEAIALKEQQTHGDIAHVMLRVPGGGGGGPARTGDVNSARVAMMLVGWHERQRSAQEIAASVVKQAQQALPGVRAMANQQGSLGRRGSGRPFEAVLGGPDYETLAKWSYKMMDLARENPGLRNLDNSYKERKPQIRVSVDRSRAAELGVSLETVGRTLETVLGSRIVTTYVDRGREYNVILQAAAEARETITDLTNIRVRSARGDTLIPLSNVVHLEETAGAVQLPRFNRLRSIEIKADLAPGYTMGEAIEWFQQTAARELPEATVMWDGDSGEYMRTGQQMYLTFVFALAIVFLVLAAQFESFVHPAIIMVTVPLALLGAVFGLKLYGATVNIFSQIAVIMLIGIAAKNGVLIVEFANQLRDQGVEFAEAVVKAAETRLRPVLMTSLCTAFGALPLLFATGAGSEQRIPIGIVVFYGTIVSVFLTLFAVPAVYSVFARRTRSPQHVSRALDRMLGEQPPATDRHGDSPAA
ncbi:efflux RND transporter permease subunit [Steroidobacter sp.]|uniref:efflux RND transporter permease subunit n=1 Tax=Steroidobacter sp. TaxID=1978227 RepID=UPI001A562D87|nr:efflux RND transporter permease subunit [Steroidobacter sp.]MBL8270511.1 efflux RND transporter permease subunit [Steroidobacter sp.]